MIHFVCRFAAVTGRYLAELTAVARLSADALLLGACCHHGDHVAAENTSFQPISPANCRHPGTAHALGAKHFFPDAPLVWNRRGVALTGGDGNEPSVVAARSAPDRFEMPAT